MKIPLPFRSLISILCAAAMIAPSAATAQVVVAPEAGPVEPLGMPVGAAPELPAGFSLQTFSLEPGQGLDSQWLSERTQSLRTSQPREFEALSGQEPRRADDRGGYGKVGQPARLSDLRDEKARTPENLAREFDRSGSGLGIVAGPIRTTVNGVQLDPIPAAPDASAHPQQLQSYEVKLRAPGSGFRSWIARALGGSDEPPSINADPSNPASIEAALRAYFRTQPQDFGGLQPGDLAIRYVEKVPGKAGLTDAYYAYFVQTKDGRPIDDAHVGVTLKMVRGKLSILSTRVRVFKSLPDVPTSPFPDDQLEDRARARLGQQPNSATPIELKLLGQQVKFLGGQWRTVQVYFAAKFGVYVGVDIKDGSSYAWEGRVRAASGEAKGRGNLDGPFVQDKPLDTMPLPHLKIEVAGGEAVYTDKQGKFTVPGSGDKPVKLTARLEGRFAAVRNQAGDDLVFSGEAVPGQTLVAVFNPEGQEETKAALVNAYYHITDVHDWMGEHGVHADTLDQPIPINVNIDDECNAYYTPGSPSVNTFKMSARCANTAFASVLRHEYGGHAFDDAIAGIPAGDVSEAEGDNVSMFMSGEPRIGVGFLLGQGDGSIRSGVNDYKWRRGDEVHKAGLALIGYTWGTREDLKALLGDAGIALAEHLVIPLPYAKPRDMPQAFHEIMLRDVDADGNIPHFKILQANARKHGIELKPPRGIGPVEALAALAGRLARGLTGRS